MEMISVEGKTNFFEKRVGEYALANKERDENVFDLECAFYLLLYMHFGELP